MQIGQVPVMFSPDPVINDTRSVTMDAETGDVIAPSLRPGEAIPEPVQVSATPEIAGTWALVGVAAAVLWLMTRRRRRR